MLCLNIFDLCSLKFVDRFFLEPTQEFLLELQKTTTSALMQHGSLGMLHFLSCLSEMLTFFICIFLLKQWLQFDLFRDYLWAPEASVFALQINNNQVPKSLKSKRFWRRKNRSRSPSRSVGRSEISESEIFTSSEEDISSISIDDVSSDDEEPEEQEEKDLEVEIIELPSSDDITEDLDDEDSFHSNLLQEEELSQVSSIDSQLSWIQEHYCYASQCSSR